MPRRTSLMSAPSRSHRLAISLMKLILVASMALATYLVISALSGDMTRNGRSVRRNGAYSSRSTSADLRPADADDDAVGLHEVVDGRPFLEELRVAGHVQRDAGRARPGARPRSRLVPTGTVLLMTTIFGPVGVLGEGVGDGPDGGQVGGAVGGLRRADGDEDELRRGDARGQVGGEVQPALAAVALHQFQQARLVDRQLAALEHVDLARRPCRCTTTSLPLSAKQVPVTRPT